MVEWRDEGIGKGKQTTIEKVYSNKSKQESRENYTAKISKKIKEAKKLQIRYKETVDNRKKVKGIEQKDIKAVNEPKVELKAWKECYRNKFGDTIPGILFLNSNLD